MYTVSIPTAPPPITTAFQTQATPWPTTATGLSPHPMTFDTFTPQAANPQTVQSVEKELLAWLQELSKQDGPARQWLRANIPAKLVHDLRQAQQDPGQIKALAQTELKQNPQIQKWLQEFKNSPWFIRSAVQNLGIKLLPDHAVKFVQEMGLIDSKA